MKISTELLAVLTAVGSKIGISSRVQETRVVLQKLDGLDASDRNVSRCQVVKAELKGVYLRLDAATGKGVSPQDVIALQVLGPKGQVHHVWLSAGNWHAWFRSPETTELRNHFGLAEIAPTSEAPGEFAATAS